MKLQRIMKYKFAGGEQMNYFHIHIEGRILVIWDPVKVSMQQVGTNSQDVLSRCSDTFEHSWETLFCFCCCWLISNLSLLSMTLGICIREVFVIQRLSLRTSICGANQEPELALWITELMYECDLHTLMLNRNCSHSKVNVLTIFKFCFKVNLWFSSFQFF